MANFFYAIAVFADGHKETFEGRLWMLGGVRDEQGHAMLNSLREKQASGEIVSLSMDFES